MDLLLNVHRAIAKSQSYQNFVNILYECCQIQSTMPASDFYQSQAYTRVKKNIRQLSIENMKQVLSQLPQLEKITVFILETNPNFTLAFVLVPQGKSFTWHDHPEMNAFIKCEYGRLKIDGIDTKKIREEDNKIFYPKNKIRQETLSSQEEQNISMIEPGSIDAHKIVAIEQAAFFDFMTPDYQDKVCSSFETISENEVEIQLGRLSDEYIEDIDLFTDFNYEE